MRACIDSRPLRARGEIDMSTGPVIGPESVLSVRHTMALARATVPLTPVRYTARALSAAMAVPGHICAKMDEMLTVQCIALWGEPSAKAGISAA